MSGGECWGGKENRESGVGRSEARIGATTENVRARESLAEKGTLKQRLRSEEASVGTWGGKALGRRIASAKVLWQKHPWNAQGTLGRPGCLEGNKGEGRGIGDEVGR